MKLDKRIRSLSDILTSFDFDIEKAKQFLDQKGYFADDLYCFVDLRSCSYGTLANILDDLDNTFQMEEDGIYHSYFIPECFVKPKEKKYRPYTIEEFCNEGFEIVVFRSKIDESPEYHVRYNGYIKYDYVCNFILGTISYTLSDLFENYEYLDDDGEWKPFGVEE